MTEITGGNKMIETRDLIIDKAKLEDWEDMYRNVWSRRECARYMMWRVTENEEDAKIRIGKTIEFQKTHDTYLVYEKKSGKAIGFAGVEKSEPFVYEEAGICLGSDYWGKGYGKQILEGLIEYVKDKFGAREFIYSAREENTASKRLAEALGFVPVSSEIKTDERDGHEYRYLKYRKNISMNVVRLDKENSGETARLMNRIKPEWWRTAEEAYSQLTDIGESIDTVGWVLTDKSNIPIGWSLFRELKGYLTLELECCGYDDGGVFKLEHKLRDLFDTAVQYAESKGYTSIRMGMSTVNFNIDGKPIEDISEAMKSLSTERPDYRWLLDYGFRVIGIQPNVYKNNCHMIILYKEI